MSEPDTETLSIAQATLPGFLTKLAFASYKNQRKTGKTRVWARGNAAGVGAVFAVELYGCPDGTNRENARAARWDFTSTASGWSEWERLPADLDGPMAFWAVKAVLNPGDIELRFERVD